MFLEDGSALIQIIITAFIAYSVLIICLRISGKRTLAKWNAFDFVMTIALGSILASVILIEDVTLSEGILAFALLILFQYIITWLTVRVPFIQKLIKGNPTLLFDKGEFIHDALKSQRVTQSEVMAAIRESGILSLENVSAVVLETDGSFSVMGKSENSSRTALKDVK